MSGEIGVANSARQAVPLAQAPVPCCRSREHGCRCGPGRDPAPGPAALGGSARARARRSDRPRRRGARVARRRAALPALAVRRGRDGRCGRVPRPRSARAGRAGRIARVRPRARVDHARRRPLRLHVRRQPAVPLRGRPLLPPLLRRVLHRDRAAAPVAHLAVQREPVARRPDGGADRRSRRLGSAPAAGRCEHPRLAARRAHEPRLSARRHRAARDAGLHLRRERLAARPRMGPSRGGSPPEHDRRRALPLPDVGRNLRRGHLARHALAGVDRADRVLDVARADGGPPARGARAAHRSSARPSPAA